MTKKLSERKVSRFTGCTGHGLAVLKVLKKAVAQKIYWENFRIVLKIPSTFLSLAFVIYHIKKHKKVKIKK